MSLRLIRRAIPLLGALLLVASQFTVALYACNMAEMAMSDSSELPEMGDRMKQMDSAPQPLLCKMHCDQDAQSSATGIPRLPLPVLSLVLLAVPLSPFSGTCPLVAATFPVGARVASSPPIRFQYQTFRN